MLMEIAKARLLNHHLGRLPDEGRASPAQISMSKLNSVREAMKTDGAVFPSVRISGMNWGTARRRGGGFLSPAW